MPAALIFTTLLKNYLDVAALRAGFTDELVKLLNSNKQVCRILTLMLYIEMTSGRYAKDLRLGEN